MTFTVKWIAFAENRLAAIWLSALDKNAVTRAAQRVDMLLASSPLEHGESRAGADRIMFEPPLAVTYRVDLAARLVHVLAVAPMRGA